MPPAWSICIISEVPDRGRPETTMISGSTCIRPSPHRTCAIRDVPSARAARRRRPSGTPRTSRASHGRCRWSTQDDRDSDLDRLDRRIVRRTAARADAAGRPTRSGRSSARCTSHESVAHGQFLPDSLTARSSTGDGIRPGAAMFQQIIRWLGTRTGPIVHFHGRRRAPAAPRAMRPPVAGQQHRQRPLFPDPQRPGLVPERELSQQQAHGHDHHQHRHDRQQQQPAVRARVRLPGSGGSPTALS